jgi:hypothetical protein
VTPGRPIGNRLLIKFFEPPGRGLRDQPTKKERNAMTQEHSEDQARRAAKQMRTILLAYIFSVLTLTNASAAETQCRSICDYYQCFTRCRQVYSLQELYERNQYNSERELDYRRRDQGHGSRYRLDNACTRALEAGVDPELMTSYGCRN